LLIFFKFRLLFRVLWLSIATFTAPRSLINWKSYRARLLSIAREIAKIKMPGQYRSTVSNLLKNDKDLVLFDPPIHWQIDKHLIHEIRDLAKKVHFDKMLLIAHGVLGQEVANVAQPFDEASSLTGIMLTKLNGDRRTGAALSRKVTEVSIRRMGRGRQSKPSTFFIRHVAPSGFSV
jgi:hypothetical protein